MALPGVAGGITVGLQYQAGGGVKVNEVASEVGLGWAMSGGGAITRDVKGFPDDSEYGWFIDVGGGSGSTYRHRFFPGLVFYPPLSMQTAGDVVRYFKSDSGNYYNTPGGTVHYGAASASENNIFLTWLYPASQAASYGQYSWFAYTPIPGQPNSPGNYIARWSGYFSPDNEPDIYTLTLPTGSLQFVFDPRGVPVPLQAQDIKIEALNLGVREFNAAGILHEFCVTTGDGVKYYFGSAAGSSDFKESVTVTTRVLEIPGLASKKDPLPYISKWHLRKIGYPSGEEINYTYSAGKSYEIATNNYLQQDWVYTTKDGVLAFNCQHCDDRAHAWRMRSWQRRYTVRTTVSSSNAKQLASITSVQGSLQFSYQSAARKDVGGATNALSGIRLLNTAGELIRQLDLVQHYADYGQSVPNAMPYDRYHLMLDRIIDRGAGCDYTKLWQFGYDQNTFCRNAATKDYWGYLNGLTYPADGTLVAPYVRSLIFTNNYALTGRNRDPNVGFTQYMVLQSITSATGSVQSFAYQLHDDNVGIGSNTINRSIGGLRIYRISKYDGVDHNNDIVDEFAYRKAVSANESSGVWGDGGMYTKLQLIHDAVGRSATSRPYDPVPSDADLRGMAPTVCNDGNFSSILRMDYYYMLRSDASMYEYAADYIDYTCVTVSRGAKGKTRYEFTSWADAAHRDYTDPDTRQVGNNLNTCPDDPLNPARRGQVLPLPFSLEVDGLSLLSSFNGTPVHTDGISADFPRRSSRSAERGLPLRVTQLTSSGVAVAATINEYDFSHPTVTLPIVNAVYVKPSFETLGFSQFFTYFQLYYYNISSQWCPLKETTEVVYNQQAAGDISQSVATKTVVEYSNFYPSKVIKFTVACSNPTNCQSNTSGRYYVTEYRRAIDINNSGPTAPYQNTTPWLLRNAYMFAPVVEEEQYTTATLNGPKVNHLGASLTEYKTDNGHIVPFETYKSLNASAFMPAHTNYIGNVWTLVRDPSYRLTATVTGYNVNALPINTIGRDGIPQATIWGYGHTLPIATVTNGTAATGSSGNGLLANAGHTSYEEEGADGDGWSVPADKAAEGKTGVRCAWYKRSTSPYGMGKTLLLGPGANRHGTLVFSCWAKAPAGASVPTTFNLVATCASITPYGFMQSPGAFQVSPGDDWKYQEFVINLDDPTWNGQPANQALPLLLFMHMQNGDGLLVDEARVHRADAQMQTVTHRPLVGKTSATGVDGRTAYFTYDSSNSPELVLNHNRDVLTRSQSKVVNETRLSANFSPDYGNTQSPVSFVAELSACADGTTFTWDFGDNSPIATGPSTSHPYSVLGTYQVTLITSNQKKGVAKLTKAVSICGPYATSIDVVSGDLNVDCCTNIGDPAVVLTARIDNSQCYQAASYQWQKERSNGSWDNVPSATSADFSFLVPCGATVHYRCIIVATDGNTNEFDPAMPIVSATGNNTNGGGVYCGLVSPRNRF